MLEEYQRIMREDMKSACFLEDILQVLPQTVTGFDGETRI